LPTVGENRDRLDPQIPDLTRDAFGLLLIGARVDHDTRAFAGQLQHGRSADIAPRSGDQRDLPFALAHVPSRCELFGGGPGRLSGLAQHPFSRCGDAGASEKARILTAEEPHDVGEREVAEIGRGRQSVFDHLIGLGHDLGHVRHVEMADVRAEDRIEPGAQWIGARIEGSNVRRVVGLAAEIERRHEEVTPVLLLADLAGAVVVEIVDAAAQFLLAREELAALPLQRRSERFATVLLGEVQQHCAVDIAWVDLFQAFEAALFPPAATFSV